MLYLGFKYLVLISDLLSLLDFLVLDYGSTEHFNLVDLVYFVSIPDVFIDKILLNMMAFVRIGLILFLINHLQGPLGK